MSVVLPINQEKVLPWRMSRTHARDTTASEDERRGGPFGLLFTVVMSSFGRQKKSRTSKNLLQQVARASQVAKQACPELPMALVTNFAVNSSNRPIHVDKMVRLGNHWMGSALGIFSNFWRLRLAALDASPFELTLSVDSTVTVCAGELLRSALYREHLANRFDFAVNLEASRLLSPADLIHRATSTSSLHNMAGNQSDHPYHIHQQRGVGKKKPSKSPRPSALGAHLPRSLEDVLPHNFVMITRRGPGLTALLKLWATALRFYPDDQVALRVVFRALARRGWQECGGHGAGGPIRRLSVHSTSSKSPTKQARRWWFMDAIPGRSRSHSALGKTNGKNKQNQINRDLSGRSRTYGGCTAVRVLRLSEAFVGLKSADKLLPDWSTVWPRYTRPFEGPAFLLHSYSARDSKTEPSALVRTVCELLQRNAPFRRILIQGSTSGVYAAPTTQAACMDATRSSRQAKRASAVLIDKVCSLLPEQPQLPAAARPVDIVESRDSFWLWMQAKNLTASSTKLPALPIDRRATSLAL